MSYAGQPSRPGPRGYDAPGYQVQRKRVRARAQAGELCWFWRRSGHADCPGGWNWDLPAGHRWAFTVHHLDRIMDGGDMAADADRMAPAHRSCNSRDGLLSQNGRRQCATLPSVGQGEGHAEWHSREW